VRPSSHHSAEANLAVDRPIFVIGTGRCGSTTLMDLIAYHPAFAWASQYTARRPFTDRAAILSRAVELPIVGSRARFARLMPKHAENYEQWNRCFPGFAEPFRDLVANDVTPRVRQRFRTTVEAICKYQQKARFMTKYTGWSRIEFIRSIFPDARFIHLVRDGRAVAYSFTTMPWWDGWAGPNRSRWSTLNGDMYEALARYDQSFLALAAVQWSTLINNICAKSELLPIDDQLLLRYEDVVRDPIGAARQCVVFAGEDDSDQRFASHLRIAAPRIVNSDVGPTPPPWKQNLSREQIDMIDDICGKELVRFGYL